MPRIVFQSYKNAHCVKGRYSFPFLCPKQAFKDVSPTYCKGRMKNKGPDIEKQIFSSLVHSTNWPRQFSRAKLKPEFWNSISVSAVGGGVPSTQPMPHCCPHCITRELEGKQKQSSPIPGGHSVCCAKCPRLPYQFHSPWTLQVPHIHHGLESALHCLESSPQCYSSSKINAEIKSKHPQMFILVQQWCWIDTKQMKFLFVFLQFLLVTHFYHTLQNYCLWQTRNIIEIIFHQKQFAKKKIIKWNLRGRFNLHTQQERWL